MKKILAVPAVVALTAAGSWAALPAFAATKGVSVKDDSFSPKSLHVSKGTTVKWTWKGSAPHNVTRTSGPAFKASKTQTSGTFSHKFAKAGTYHLVCTIHAAEGMKMTVVVK